jgi:chromosome partitioning protein
LIVVAPGYFELDSIVQLNKTLEEVRQYFNPRLDTAASLQILRQTYTDKVVRTVIPRNTDLKDAHFNKLDIFTFNPRSKAAMAYDKLIRELFVPEEAAKSA